MNKETRIFEEGYAVFDDGKSLKDNPYKDENENHWWSLGWRKAKQDYLDSCV